MRRLVNEVVAATTSGRSPALPPMPIRARPARAVYDAVARFGPLQRHIDNPTVEDICIEHRFTQGRAVRRLMAALTAPPGGRLLLLGVDFGVHAAHSQPTSMKRRENADGLGRCAYHF